MPAGLQFVLFLLDGSKSLIPADWTDFKPASCAPQAPVLVGSRDDLLRLRGLVDAVLRRSAEPPVISGAVQESHAATDSELQRHPDSGDAPVGTVRQRAKANRHRDSGAPSCPIDSRSAPGAGPAITDRDRKELLRTLLEEVILNLKRAEGHAHLTLRWRGGAITVLDVPVPRFKPMGPRTDEDTISLLRRLATLYPDEVIAGILNRQGRQTATGERFTANQVGSLRRYRNISRFQPSADPPIGELVSIRKAAQILGMNTSHPPSTLETRSARPPPTSPNLRIAAARSPARER
ncbi:MAG TPA: hypothetical protein VN736_08610 [Candidatus Limnocylindrales bacterium]|nr:hypothetical protein [Candidatus Limnocylindrales bacterium]